MEAVNLGTITRELIGPQSAPKWPARPLYLHFPHLHNLHFQQNTIYILNKYNLHFHEKLL